MRSHLSPLPPLWPWALFNAAGGCIILWRSDDSNGGWQIWPPKKWSWHDPLSHRYVIRRLAVFFSLFISSSPAPNLFPRSYSFPTSTTATIPAILLYRFFLRWPFVPFDQAEASALPFTTSSACCTLTALHRVGRVSIERLVSPPNCCCYYCYGFHRYPLLVQRNIFTR